MEDLRPVRVFLEVAAQSSFAGAARTLGMTPASVTRIVARLEDLLGQQLLVRTTRQVSLTSAGALVAARFGPLLAEVDRATKEIALAHMPDRGRLRINAPLSMGLRLLPPLIESFRLAYPKIDLDITMTDTLVDVIAETCDLAIRVSGPPADKSTIWRKICEVPRHAVASPALFERVPRPESPDQLDSALCLSYRSETGPETWSFRKGAAQRTVRAGRSVMSNNGDLLYALVRAGGGIAMLPDFITQPGIARGEIVPILEDWQIPSLWLTLYYPPYEQLPPLVATFSDFFAAYLRDVEGLSFAEATMP